MSTSGRPFTRHRAQELLGFEEVREALNEGLNTMFRQRSMPMGDYMRLFTLVHEYCQSANSQRSPYCSSGRQPRTLQSLARRMFFTRSAGRRVYELVKGFLYSYLAEVSAEGKKLGGQALLQFYREQWQSYMLSAKVLKALLAIFNKTWLVRERTVYSQNFHYVYNLCLVAWKESVLNPLNELISKALLDMIKNLRKEDHDHDHAGFFRDLIGSFVELGFNPDDPEDRGPFLVVYRELFEGAFLQHTKRFYRVEGARLLPLECARDFARKVEALARKEQELMQSVGIPTSTQQSVKVMGRRILIGKRQDILVDKFQIALATDNKEDLGCLYSLLSSIKYDWKQMSQTLVNQILQQGLAAIPRGEDASASDQTAFVEAVVAVHAKYKVLVSDVFQGQRELCAAFEKACQKLVNTNAMTTTSSGGKTSAELLASYSDRLLCKRSQNTDEELKEKFLNNMTTVFKYIQDKDVFKKHYRRLLAKRLVSQCSASPEAENEAISRLQLAAGDSEMEGLKRMLKDCVLSKTLCKQFKQHWQQHITEPLDIKFRVKVLTSQLWPFSQPGSFTLPVELEKYIQLFTAFYNSHKKRRRLQWHYSISWGEVVTHCFQSRYTLRVSTYQMAVLLQFNTSDTLSVQHLLDTTQLPLELLTQVLQIFFKSGLLKCAEGGEQDLKPESQIALFLGYNNKKLRVKLDAPLKEEVRQEEQVTARHVEIDRVMTVEAVIVRIMKVSRLMEHELLVAEVVSQMSAHFIPTVAFIKERIESLIDGDYLERAGHLGDSYRYIT